MDLGFEDLSHFSVSFKKKYGINPRELPRAATKNLAAQS